MAETTPRYGVRSMSAPDEGAATMYVAPRSQTERVLARIWAQVLGVDRVGVTDDFLELGGHSLPAVRLISLVRTELGAEIPMGDLFAAPTVAAPMQRRLPPPATRQRAARRTNRPPPAPTAERPRGSARGERSAWRQGPLASPAL